ncbi:hypothetical protein OS493_024053 [Desmophyllum pertusum]|uniref:Uncharacterized protein n=1 Tax=Desmophyllum pertusum TaxID=174260 RepID=A0A9W9ZQA1_9CNID|nr:hypothetical protein OS493_024053 [Desmophyllum pertusum]
METERQVLEQGITLPKPSMTAPAPLPAALARQPELLTGTNEGHHFNLPVNAAALQKQHADKELPSPSNRSQCYRRTLFLQPPSPSPLVRFSSLHNQSVQLSRKKYQQQSHRYHHQQCATEGSACNRSVKATCSANGTTGRMGLPVGNAEKSGWLIVIASTLETGGVEKNRTSASKNGWKS